MKNRKAKSSDDEDSSAKKLDPASIKNKIIKKHSNLSNAPKRIDNTKLAIIIVILFVIPVVASWYYNMMLAARVNKPLVEPNIIDSNTYKSKENIDRFWGTYRYTHCFFFII